jgi:Trk-type K+ transport system membrane component
LAGEMNAMIKSAKLNAAVMAIISAAFAASPRTANACATCGLSSGDHAFNAYKASVLFMLASPYVSFAAIGGITYLVYRRSNRKAADSNPTIVKR